MAIIFLCSYLLTQAYSTLTFIKVVHLPQSAQKYTPEPRVKLSDSLTAACPVQSGICHKCSLINLKFRNPCSKEDFARNRLASSWEQADGSLKHPVHFKEFYNFLIIWGPSLAATLRSIVFLNYQHYPLLSHLLPVSNFLSILKIEA